MKEEQVFDKLKHYDNLYYNDPTEETLTDDEDYDIFRDQAQKDYPDNPYFQTVGAPSTYGQKITHGYRMKSCQKCNTIEDLYKWMDKKSNGMYILLPKYDGLSFTAKYESGKFVHLATRGDGEVGQDITDKAHLLKDIPETISSTATMEVRGELILPKNYPNPEDKPLRNIVGGIINRKTVTNEVNNVRAVAYRVECDVRFVSYLGMLTWLKENKFRTSVAWHSEDRSWIKSFIESFTDNTRGNFEYQLDGLVLTMNNMKDQITYAGNNDHHWEYQIAYKFPNENKTSKLLNIEWNTSRHGNVIPTAIFESIEMGGATISRATLNNYDNVLKLSLTIGDLLTVSRAGDVIPKVEENLDIKSPFEPKIIPLYCPSCNTFLIVDGVHIRCDNNACPEQRIQKIIYFTQQCKMDGVSESTIRTLYDECICLNIRGLYDIIESDLDDVFGFGIKKTRNLIEQVDKTRELSLPRFINILGISLVGEKAVKKLGIKTIDDFWNFSDTTYVIGENLIKFRDTNSEYISKLLEVIKIKRKEESVMSETKGLVVMTGKGPDTRNNLTEKLMEMGYSLGSSVTQGTEILICEDPDSGSTKLKKAEKLGVKIVSYEEFFENI